MEDIKFPSTCKFWRQNNCRFGDRCRYQHVLLDCIPYYFGNCSKGDQCQHRHRFAKPAAPHSQETIIIDLRNQLEERDTRIALLNERIRVLEDSKEISGDEDSIEMEAEINDVCSGVSVEVNEDANCGNSMARVSSKLCLATANRPLTTLRGSLSAPVIPSPNPLALLADSQPAPPNNTPPSSRALMHVKKK